MRIGKFPGCVGLHELIAISWDIGVIWRVLAQQLGPIDAISLERLYELSILNPALITVGCCAGKL